MNQEARQDNLTEHSRTDGKRSIPSIIVADDESGLLRLLDLTFSKMDLNVRLAQNGEEALRIAAEDPDGLCLAILDINMPGMSGAELVSSLYRLCPGIRIMLMSGDQSINRDAELLACHADDLILKPFSLSEIRHSVQHHLQLLGLR